MKSMATEALPTNVEQPHHPIAETHERECPFFNEREMEPPTNEYVCWTDVMGSQSVMLRSLKTASNFLMKLHVAALTAHTTNTTLELYPMIDGIYVCSPNQSHILNFVKIVHSALAVTFILETDPFHRFQIRSGLAYGPIVKGEGTLRCSDQLNNNPDHARRILLGPPLTQAYQVEKQSAPFGVALHESVRTFAPPRGVLMFGTYWKWWKYHPQPDDDALSQELSNSLQDHYAWCLEHTVALSYNKEDIERHKSLAKEYFLE
jgi:hypothetical protein